MGTHSSILAWEVSCTEDHGGLQSMGSVTKSWTQLKQFSIQVDKGGGETTVLEEV